MLTEYFQYLPSFLHYYRMFIVYLIYLGQSQLLINSKDEERDKFFSASIENIFKICTCLCIITIAAMPIIFRIMINESFGEAYIYIPLKIIGTIFEIFSGLLGAVYISLKFSKNIAFSTLVAGNNKCHY